MEVYGSKEMQQFKTKTTIIAVKRTIVVNKLSFSSNDWQRTGFTSLWHVSNEYKVGQIGLESINFKQTNVFKKYTVTPKLQTKSCKFLLFKTSICLAWIRSHDCLRHSCRRELPTLLPRVWGISFYSWFFVDNAEAEALLCSHLLLYIIQSSKWTRSLHVNDENLMAHRQTRCEEILHSFWEHVLNFSTTNLPPFMTDHCFALQHICRLF